MDNNGELNLDQRRQRMFDALAKIAPVIHELLEPGDSIRIEFEIPKQILVPNAVPERTALVICRPVQAMTLKMKVRR